MVIVIIIVALLLLVGLIYVLVAQQPGQPEPAR